MTQFVSPDDEHDVLETCRELKIKINTYVRHVGHLPKGKGLPKQAEVAQGVQGRLKPRIFLTFGTTRVVGRQPYVLATFTPG